MKIIQIVMAPFGGAGGGVELVALTEAGTLHRLISEEDAQGKNTGKLTWEAIPPISEESPLTLLAANEE